MDNVNVIRTGFLAPDFSLPDTQGNMFNFSDNIGECFIALCFFSGVDDDRAISFLKDLNSGLPKTAAGLLVKLVGISSDRVQKLEKLRHDLNLGFPLLSDARLKVAKRYYVENSQAIKPESYLSIFVIDDDGIVRHKVTEIPSVSEFSFEGFKEDIAKLI